MKNKPYPQYKPSGVAWLGDIPEHWELKRLKTASNYWVSNVDKIPSDDELPVRLCNYTDVYYNDFITPKMDFMETTATFDEIKKFHLEQGDVLITKDSEEWNDIAISSLVIETAPDIVCGYHLAIIRSIPSKLIGEYLSRQFQTSAINHQFQVAATGVTRYGLPKNAIGEAIIPLPPIAEQKGIAAFLNRETSRIDNLIGKKKKLVELLKEKRTALISRAVTKGLDPAVKLKPTGVTWLGDIPEHWIVESIKRIVAIPITDGPHETPEIFDEGIPFISAEAIKNNKIDFERKRGFITYFDHKQFSLKYHPKRNDIFMIKSGATTGNLAIVETDDEFNIWSPLAVIRVHQMKADARFVFSAMNSKEFQTSVQLFWSFGTQQNIGMRAIENLLIPLPPLLEQQSIAAFLNRETAKIDALVAKIGKAIEILNEYRLAIINATITGKIDIGEA
jgi:type I restriction enzyme, S subunit